LIHAQLFKVLWMWQHLTPLLGQGGDTTCDLLLSRHADLQHLPGFLPGWDATQGGQAKRNAIDILDLAHAVLLGQPEQRFDLIGADR